MQILMYIGAALVGIVALFIGGQLLLIHRMKRQRGQEAPELTGKPNSWVRSGKSALFYFYQDAPRKPLRSREGMKGRRSFNGPPADWC